MRTCPRTRLAGSWLAAAALIAMAVGAPAAAAGSAPSAAASGSARGAAPPADLTTLVNPFIGTANGGGTFPGADTPFGMVQYSPDTENAAGGGYDYNTPKTWGFGLTHLSGPGCHAMGDVASLPVTGPVSSVDPRAQEQAFSHADESARPGYYAVALQPSGVRAELAATTRTGWARYTFPAASQPGVIVNPGADFLGASAASVSVTGDDTIEGSVTSYGYFNVCTSKGANRYTVYFSMRFSRPFTAFAAGTGTAVTPGARTATGPGAGAYVQFGAGGGPVVSKTGISFASLAGARANLAAETGPGFGFDAVAQAAHDQWNAMLHRAEISGGDAAQQQVFYTALYHALLHPNVFSDTDGEYTGFDGKVHVLPRGQVQYANFSMWDTYRTQQQLLDLVAPERAGGMMTSLLRDYEQGGWLPRWPYASYYTNEMVGDSAANIMVDAYLKGLLPAGEVPEAYTALLHNATDVPDPAVTPFAGRTGLPEYLNLGYVPADNPEKDPYSVSATLEYGVNDCALSLMATATGHPADAAMLLDRSHSYRNLVDPGTGLVRPRMTDGSWLTPFNPVSQTGFKEGDAWQYTWLVPQDVTGLATATGGQARTLGELDQFFGYDQVAADPSQAAAVWQAGARYDPTNETDLQAPYEYTYLGEPAKTATVVHAAEADEYTTAPAGLPGNDDLGEMSAWYVMSALGLYPVFAGAPGYTLTSPLFPHAVVHLEAPWYRAPELVINAPGTSLANRYVNSVTGNGRPLRSAAITQQAISAGTTLDYSLSAAPGGSWATGPAAPRSPCTASYPVARVAAGFTGPAGSPQGVPVQLGTFSSSTGTAAARAVTLTVTAPAGWTVSPASTSAGTLAPGARAVQQWTLTPPPGTAPGTYPVRVYAHWAGPAGSGAALTTLALGQVQVTSAG